MLGRTLRGEFREHEVVVAGLPEADITDAAGIDAVCRSCKPDVLIHCAAMTDVDKCETCPDMAWKINAVGSANVASACQRNGIRLIAISTDYVFSGDSERPYTEFDTPTIPPRTFGMTKGQGSRLFVRTVRIILLSVFHGSMVPVVQALCTLC